MLSNEKGLTLLEVLLSMVILSIILVSIMSFFPQVNMLNAKNESKSNGIQAAKELLITWKGSNEAKIYLKNPDEMNRPAEYAGEDQEYYFFKTTIHGYIGDIQIKKIPDLVSGPGKPHYIYIKIADNHNGNISDTYGYIIVD
ncbi:prepilin-type N-terminal cleavage/methylation domain-containing protein [Bacillus sp. ISL-41]|uniref:type IV pilus modification PilV family protein n=1 Tax=Bacillus sp. ISL-41 TaxID=2819127 RepID=UPI001BE68D50|nr:type II secretion system protein [Bacillus sp. ISL-41]MBT2644690.1 prepilin-type N-terminal cleavage/methylation domain-containing protein [Bacillus sp. ISL-41]